MKHDHTQCEHEFKYCDKCKIVYCTKCDKEWIEQYTTSTWTYTNLGAGTTSGTIIYDNNHCK
jgi:uncharacterized Zn ribbon protein